MTFESLASTFSRIRVTRAALPDEAWCPDCGRFDVDYPGVRELLYPEGEHFAACRCEDIRKRDAMFRQQEARLPKPPKTFTTFDPTVEGVGPLYEAAQQFASGHGTPVLLIVGQVGSGKSHIAEAIGWHFLDGGKEVRYEKVSRMIMSLRDSHSLGAEASLAEWLRWYERRDLLILDDLAVRAREETAWARDVLLTIIEYRLEYRRPLVVTTNCDRDDMELALGDRIASRLYTTNPGLDAVHLVPVEAGDYRR